MGRRKTTEEFIREAEKVHGGKYDYSLVEYINNRSKVKIICKIHGAFEQNPKHHLNGVRCPNCFGHPYRKTIKKKNDLIKNGYKIISIWEIEF